MPSAVPPPPPPPPVLVEGLKVNTPVELSYCNWPPPDAAPVVTDIPCLAVARVIPEPVYRAVTYAESTIAIISAESTVPPPPVVCLACMYELSIN